MAPSFHSSPWPFFALVFCWTWCCWWLAAALGISAQSTMGRVLVIGGLFGPMLGGIGFTYLTEDDSGRRDYWSRIVDPRRVPIGWFAAVVLFAPCLMAIAAVVDAVTGGDALAGIARRVAPLAAAPAMIVPFLLRVLVYGPVPEELGWRGYALDRLQARYSTLAASLILGAIWAVWHLPLFFIDGMDPHHGAGAGSPWFWLFMAQVVASAIVYGFIFNNTRRSTLAAIVFHFTANASAELANATAGINFYATLLWIAAAVVIAVAWRAGRVTRGAA